MCIRDRIRGLNKLIPFFILFRFSTRWDKEINQIRPKVSTTTTTDDRSSGQQTSKNQQKKTNNNNKATEKNDDNESMYDVKSKMFRPFARYPEKQARYEEFLAAKKARREPVYQYDT